MLGQRLTRASERVGRENEPFLDGDGFETGFGSSDLEGETIFTADEVEGGRRNRAI